MPKRTPKGIICPTPDDYDYVVQEHKRGKILEYRPTGVFIHGSGATSYSLHYAGEEMVKCGLDGFQLPHDVGFLKDLAEALSLAATELEARRKER